MDAEGKLRALRYALGISQTTYMGLSQKGAYFPQSQSIVIEEELSLSEAIAVETHELCHALTHCGCYLPEDAPTDSDRVFAEHIAHGAAEIVCPKLGVDYREEATTYPPYPHYQPLECLTSTEQRIARGIAEWILNVLDRLPEANANEVWGYARPDAIQSLHNLGQIVDGNR